MAIKIGNPEPPVDAQQPGRGARGGRRRRSVQVFILIVILVAGTVAAIVTSMARVTRHPHATKPSGSASPSTHPSTTSTSGATSPTGVSVPGRTNCLADPAGCGYPTAATTGARGSLKTHDSITTTTDGEVIENLDIHGYIAVTSANVTIKNVRLTGGSHLGAIDLHAATGHTTITDVTIVASRDQLAGMTLRDATVTRVDISGGQDGIDSWGGSGATIVQDSYIHDLTRNTSVDSHDDTIQTSGGNQTFRHNTLLPYNGGDPMNACLQIGDLQGDLQQLTFADNLCDGGNFSVNANAHNVQIGKVTAGRLTFTGNRFGRDYRYGVRANIGAPFVSTWSDNVDDKTGEQLR